jgi:hypothetical protein
MVMPTPGDQDCWRRSLAESFVVGVTAHRPGTPPPPLVAGDFLLIRTGGLLGWSVRAGESIRPNYRRHGYAAFDHCALVTGPDRIIESDDLGVHESRISNYDESLYVLVRLSLSVEARGSAVNFSKYRCAKIHAKGRKGYDSTRQFLYSSESYFEHD